MPILHEIPAGKGRRVPIKLWTEADQVEPEALQQLENLASLPFLYKHVAVMPDVHLGKGATVGSVIATKNAVIPAAVGVDIGCGMMAVKTDLDPRYTQDEAREIRREIERIVPVGHNSHQGMLPTAAKWEGWKDYETLTHAGADRDLFSAARKQLGTLGGGNHFIELCLDGEGAVWVVLHSGSRHIGNKIAERHMNEAKGLLRQKAESLPDPDLAYFLKGTPEYAAYLRDLHWAQDYAARNRVEMMERVLEALSRILRDGEPLRRLMEVNCHHNYAEEEVHDGEKVLVTRKGAVRAGKGDYGIIPGSMGAKTFIVRGKGNGESFCSCSHGAGRKMSRNKARNTFAVEDLVRETAGVECRKDTGVLDEIPSAYKDIEGVMARQRDLVEVVAELKQFLCVKG